jgi:putative endonuclease
MTCGNRCVSSPPDERQLVVQCGVPFVYILRCGDGSLYTGAAKDLAARLARHETGKASRYTRSRLPVCLVWSRRVRTWGHALRTEHALKRLAREDKERIVAGAAWRLGRRPSCTL